MIEVEGLTAQQRMALDGLVEGLRVADDGNASLCRRAIQLAVVSGCVAALAVGACGLRTRGDGLADVVLSLLLVSMIALAAVSWFQGLHGWLPQPIKVATTGDTDVLFDRVLSVEVEDAFNQVLLDHAALFASASSENAILSNRVRWLTRLASVQVVAACVVGAVVVLSR